MKKQIFITVLLLQALTASCQKGTIRVLEKYSKNLEFKTKEQKLIPELDLLGSNWDSILTKCSNEDEIKTIQHVTIILLRLYKSHIICCKQSYTIVR